jgi:hypothetical protein
MHIIFQIQGRIDVPDGTTPLPGIENQFRLPSGQIASVHPVIELAIGPDTDDHRDLTYSEAASLGILLDLYDRTATLRTSN